MKKLVIMPGGFHPFHQGHLSLYNAAKRQFPDADVYVAATNDTSKRPFPFEIKAKLAQLAGVDPGHFIQVKSPFRPEEITKAYNPDDTELIYVRSEKDIGESPKPGGVKKDGTPAYLQPFKNQAIQPMSKHAYIAYLPTVEFAGGITSATEIRNRWPDLSEQQKVQLVNTLYPKTKQNQRLAANVIKLLNLAIQGNNQGINESQEVNEARGYDTVYELVRAFNTELTGNEESPLYVKGPGTRVWTRGDGVRHRDPGQVRLDPWMPDADKKKWSKQKAVRKFWKWLTTRPGVKSIGQVSGEFGTSPMMDAVRLGNLYFASTPYDAVLWGSVSRFKNPRSVWRHQDPEVKESMCAKHISPSGAETTMCPDDEDYEINYGKNSGIADFRKKQGLDVRTGKKIKEGNDDADYVQQITSEFIRKVQPMRSRITDRKTIIGLLDRFFDKFAIPEEYFDDVYHMAARRLESEQSVDEGLKGKVAAGLTAAALAANAASAPSVAGVIASQAAARHAAAAREQPSAPVKKRELPDIGALFQQLKDKLQDKKSSVKETKKQSTQSKFEKHLAKHGYDVAEKSKYWDQKVKDIDAQIAAWDAEMQRRKRENLPESIKRAIMEGGHSLEDFDYVAEKK